jgi:hypothetical protein
MQLNSAIIWFNLAQAHGRNIEVTQHEDALTVAQDIDPALVGKLAERIGNAEQGFVADLPLPSGQIHRRMLLGSGSAFADQTRRAWAPGWLGAYPGMGAGLFLLLIFVAGSWRKRAARSQWCSRCVAISSGQIGVDAARDALCDACRKSQGRQRQRWEQDIEPELRWPRYVRLVIRVLGCFFPGVGLTIPRPLAAWAGLSGAALAVAIWWYGSARIPDPLAMGAAAGWIASLLGAFGGGFYLLAGCLHARAGGR